MDSLIPQGPTSRRRMTTTCTYDYPQSSYPPTKETEPEHNPHPIPEHWKLDRESNWFILRLIFKVFCAIGHGHADIDSVWDLMHGDKFTDHKDRLASRYSSLAVMGGLLLATTATFVTTEPPRPDLLNYTERAPYLFLGFALAATLIGAILASSIGWGLSKCTTWWYCEVMMGSRLRVFFTITLMAAPFLIIGLATVMEGIGFLIAAVNSGDPLVVIGTTGMCSFFVILAFIVAWIHSRYLSQAVQRLNYESSSSLTVGSSRA
ncbi:hypothetical protein K435DRAFT_960718 [Dendrothele bispora CBS 962.96]|uniref:Uncharacterized protein n=1 Tax=Dendrothele bispora (strain CBS 962.96) TaxID=1314807 RepID=A0A4S8MTK3_DENBC|nr:hypothetical protein K435DRAFT_960718 [Dendrothele bispora CBS 962.96]